MLIVTILLQVSSCSSQSRYAIDLYADLALLYLVAVGQLQSSWGTPNSAPLILLGST